MANCGTLETIAPDGLGSLPRGADGTPLPRRGPAPLPTRSSPRPLPPARTPHLPPRPPHPAGRDKLVVALNSALFFGVGVFALFGGSQYVIDVEPYVKKAKALEESFAQARSSPQPAASEFAKRLESVSPALASTVRPIERADADPGPAPKD